MPIPLAMDYHLAKEKHEVSLESGINLPQDLPLRTLKSAASAPSIIHSMLQDIRNGRETEVESLCDNATRLVC